MPIRHVLVLILFAADFAAILTVLASEQPRSVRARWCALIVLLPFAGVTLWLRQNRTRTVGPVSRWASTGRFRGPTH